MSFRRVLSACCALALVACEGEGDDVSDLLHDAGQVADGAAGGEPGASAGGGPGAGLGGGADGGASDGGNVAADGQTLGQDGGVLADGSLAEMPVKYDLSCVNLRTLGTRPFRDGSGGVAVFFEADDCKGVPIAADFGLDYAKTNLVVSENGNPLSTVEAAATVASARGQEIFVNLLFDVSGSTRTETILSQIRSAATAFVDTVKPDALGASPRVQVGIQLFAGNATIVELLAPTLDKARIKAAIASISTSAAQKPNLSAYPLDVASTNLFGALREGLKALDVGKTKFEERNAGGAFAAGYLVVFTDGKDTSARLKEADAVAALAATNNIVVGVALKSPDYDVAADATLDAVTDIKLVAESTTLSTTFGDLATRMRQQFKSTYLLGYCTPDRSGTLREVSIGFKNTRNNARAIASFTAPTTVSGTCGVSTFDFDTRCKGFSCGGLGCGACDDSTSYCNSAGDLSYRPWYDTTGSDGGVPVMPGMDGGVVMTDASVQYRDANAGSSSARWNVGSCENFCERMDLCANQTLVNPNGYEQRCGAPAVLSCDSQCVNALTDNNHCGGCGIRCSNPKRCAEGVCK